MLFVDTNVFVEVIRRNPQVLKWLATMMNERIVLHGHVLLELLVGARDKAEIREIERFAKIFQIYWPTNSDYQRAIDLAKTYYHQGLGAVDAVIAASALNKHLPLCTIDRDFIPVTNLKIIEPYARPQR